jgi:hypothetical protein
MTFKQYNKVTIGDKLTMFDGGTLLAKYKMNVVVRMRDTPQLVRSGHKYLVAHLIEQNGTLYIDSDMAMYCRYEDDAMKHLRTYDRLVYGL